MIETTSIIRDAVLASVPTTLASMFDAAAKEQDPPPQAEEVDEVQALIGFEGTHRGMMVVRLPGPTACALAGSFVGEAYDEINEDVRDCAMEIVNILIGQLKADLAAQQSENSDFIFNFSLPKIMVGRAVDGSPDPQVQSITVHFGSDHGPLAIKTDYEID